ncbi:alpha-ketoacid dehydrogenase subunit alpha/beta [Phnomibacter ginsenosidimutans]|uniref:alpha-ketoacid dehydrogenase subunit alpha/beta n=1 Tax=Phnomibacter ginsenosidimutans TaxID=2676868 RepID=UPI001FE9F05D|nr:alpha-ketoacid dehydrogenase subunit alpha/beta [Phnomibacter ginsenosidimutans]
MIEQQLLHKAYRLMYASVCMANKYEENRSVCKYVHSTSLGHQAIQLAVAFQLRPEDWVSPYYRDESILLGIGMEPADLMRQLLAKANDPFSGGRSYYSHPSLNDADKPRIMHQSSATGMQVIPATGAAHGLQMLNKPGLVVCSLGDASMTEGEVAEALQVAVLHKLPILYLVQDNGWGISATATESRVMSAVQYAQGFPGLTAIEIDGTDFAKCYSTVADVLQHLRSGAGPVLLQANVPLLGHHTSGVRKEFYRNENELQQEAERDPVQKLKTSLLAQGLTPAQLQDIEKAAQQWVDEAFEAAQASPDPDAATVTQHVFAPTPVLEEKGNRQPANAAAIPMVDAALFAIREIMQQHPEAVLYGQDVGRRLGGVFREAATLADQFGDNRVFNTAIQEAYIIGSTAGMSAVGVKPIVEIQFADYIYPGFNQLVTELSKSCYLSMGKFPVSAVIRVPTGAYGGGGPYHSGSIESTLLSIKGIKVVYPSNAADMKGLMKAAFFDPNPVVMLEHKGLYWSKVPGTDAAKTPEPDADYIIPLGKGRIVQAASEAAIAAGESCCVITYGMGVHWAIGAAKAFAQQVEIIDLRSLYPLDEAMMYAAVQKHGKCLVLTEEQQAHSYAESLAGRIQQHCFQYLDAPVQVMGALDRQLYPFMYSLNRLCCQQ